MSIPADHFSSEDISHITNESAGDSSAVSSQGPEKRLRVDPQGLKDSSGKWVVNRDPGTGNYQIHLSSDENQYICPDYGGSPIDPKYLMTGIHRKLWGFLPVDPNDHTLAYIQDPITKDVWQYDKGNSMMIKLAPHVKDEKTQIWTFA